jgi:hypothetical protein
MYRSEYRDWLARFESRYITLTMNRDLEYCHELPLEKFCILVVIVDKRRSQGRLEVLLLTNEDFDHCTDRHIFCTTMGG